MNERIKELLNQSTTVNHGVIQPRRIMTEYNVDHDKFAKSIIKECLGDLKERIALRYQGSDRDRDIGYGMEIVYMDIVDKFGVE